jgi:hypothetical protein
MKHDFFENLLRLLTILALAFIGFELHTLNSRLKSPTVTVTGEPFGGLHPIHVKVKD